MGSCTSTASERAPSQSVEVLWPCPAFLGQVEVQSKNWFCTATAPESFRGSELGQSTAQAPQGLWGKLGTKPP